MDIDESNRGSVSLTVTVRQAAIMLGIGRATAYEGVRTKVIPSIRVGRRLVVPIVALERMLGGESTDGA